MVFTLNIRVKELNGKYDRNTQTQTLCVNELSGSFQVFFWSLLNMNIGFSMFIIISHTVKTRN